MASRQASSKSPLSGTVIVRSRVRPPIAGRATTRWISPRSRASAQPRLPGRWHSWAPWSILPRSNRPSTTHSVLERVELGSSKRSSDCDAPAQQAPPSWNDCSTTPADRGNCLTHTSNACCNGCLRCRGFPPRCCSTRCTFGPVGHADSIWRFQMSNSRSKPIRTNGTRADRTGTLINSDTSNLRLQDGPSSTSPGRCCSGPTRPWKPSPLVTGSSKRHD